MNKNTKPMKEPTGQQHFRSTQTQTISLGPIYSTGLAHYYSTTNFHLLNSFSQGWLETADESAKVDESAKRSSFVK
jgi:hypothetical protein